MSALRELPPDQEVEPSRWSRSRLVPLALLFIASGAAAVVGAVWRATAGAGQQ